jgi:hypothetical protein
LYYAISKLIEPIPFSHSAEKSTRMSFGLNCPAV